MAIDSGLDLRALRQMPVDGPGWDVVESALLHARTLYGDRLVAVYAIGSLAHGGFSPAASDVDVLLILDTLDEKSVAQMAALRTSVTAELATTLAKRLSLFWSSWQDLHRPSSLSRLPLVDRIDLTSHGRCLWGLDRRAEISLPSGEARRNALVIESARFMLEKLATPEKDALLKDPERLAALGCREVTKAVLFPVRFLYTAATGLADGNEPAVVYCAAHNAGPIADLSVAALAWRRASALPSLRDLLPFLQAGLLPLYAELLRVYQAAATHCGEGDLAQGFQHWAKRLLG